MDSVERREGVLADGVRAAQSFGIRVPTRLGSLRGWLMVGALGLAALFGAVPTMGPRATAFTVVDGGGGPVIRTVGIGSTLWIAGVRAGIAGEWQTVNGVPQHTLAVELPGYQLGIPVLLPQLDRGGLLLGVAVGLAAIALRLLRLPAAVPLAAAAAGIALLPVQRELGLPAALPLVVLPPLIALLAVRLPNARSQRAYDGLALLLIAMLSVAAVTFATSVSDGAWQFVWLLPMAVGVLLAGGAELYTLATRYQALPVGSHRRLLAAAVPIASDSRLAGADDERSRMAIELHNTVLPRLATSARALRDTDSVEAASDGLDAIADELRGVMGREQTVILELGGVAEALRAEAARVGAPGVPIRFDVRGTRSRPPRRVELAAYRIGQAALDNAVRHSGADRVQVVISSAADIFELTVSDDGVGLDDTAEDGARRRGRIGLAQMRLRAESVGGTLDIGTQRDGGTAVRFFWAA